MSDDEKGVHAHSCIGGAFKVDSGADFLYVFYVQKFLLTKGSNADMVV